MIETVAPTTNCSPVQGGSRTHLALVAPVALSLTISVTVRFSCGRTDSIRHRRHSERSSVNFSASSRACKSSPKVSSSSSSKRPSNSLSLNIGLSFNLSGVLFRPNSAVPQTFFLG
uniref:(northern house mosquito) hypothetical protein n=1 Tax=Culex pipiens TaxID=7175 RepID=A0A8D8NP90_CULPI